MPDCPLPSHRRVQTSVPCPSSLPTYQRRRDCVVGQRLTANAETRSAASQFEGYLEHLHTSFFFELKRKRWTARCIVGTLTLMPVCWVNRSHNSDSIASFCSSSKRCTSCRRSPSILGRKYPPRRCNLHLPA